MFKKVASLILLISLGNTATYAENGERRPLPQTENGERHTSDFQRIWLDSLVSIEVSTTPLQQVTSYSGTISVGSGFLVYTPNEHIVLITAKHVVFGDEGKGSLRQGLAYRLSRNRKGNIMTDENETKITQKAWLKSADEDIAFRFMSTFDTYTALGYSAFLPTNKLEAGASLFIIGFPMGIRSTQYSQPILRKAIVARIDDDGIILDGFVFPGNSGGPVVYQQPFSAVKTDSSLMEGDWFAGMVTSYIPYTDVAISQQTLRPRISFEENSGLSQIISADKILKILQSPEFMALDKK